MLLLVNFGFFVLLTTTTTTTTNAQFDNTGSNNNQSYAPIVQMNDGGQICGLRLKMPNNNNKTVYLYQGIPYGHAERFRKPQKAKRWQGVYNATSWRYACPQQGIPLRNVSDFEQFWSQNNTSEQAINQTTVSNEDCLYLNVWQPVDDHSHQSSNNSSFHNSTKHSVLVWFHGGSFQVGTIFSKDYDARYIASLGDVVVVTVQYRLGVFGFLYGGDHSEMPGNLGIYDQIEALKWIRKNIDQFSGDPNNVTITGQSAGSMSVSVLIASPQTKGLFHRAIMQSGALLGFYPMSKFDAKKKTRMLSTLVDCKKTSVEDSAKCMRRISPETLLNANLAMNQVGQMMIPIYGGSDDDLLPLQPLNALMDGKFDTKIDLLFGVTADEGQPSAYEMFPALENARNGSTNGDDNDEMVITFETIKQNIRIVLEVLKMPYLNETLQFYLPNNQSLNKNQTALIDAVANVIGDLGIVCPTYTFAQQMAQTNESSSTNHYYAYRLTQPISSYRNALPKCTSSSMGVCHSTDVVYLFGWPLANEQESSDEEQSLSKAMIGAWTNFVKYGQPGSMPDDEKWESAFGNSSSSSSSSAATNSSDLVIKYMTLETGNYHMTTDGVFGKVCRKFWTPKYYSLLQNGGDDHDD